MYHSLFTHWSGGGHFGCLQIGTITDKDTNIWVQILVCTLVFIFVNRHPGVQWLSFSICLVLLETAKLFSKRHSYQQCMRNLRIANLGSIRHCLWYVDGMECHLSVVLVCICRVDTEVTHLFMCSFVILMSSLVKTSLCVFCLVSFSFLAVLGLNSVLHTC
jgi:hypothetical protein